MVGLEISVGQDKVGMVVCELLFIHFGLVLQLSGFPGGSDSKESACNAGNQSSVPGLERSPRKGNGNPFHYSCLESPMDRGAWQATVHGVAKSRT